MAEHTLPAHACMRADRPRLHAAPCMLPQLNTLWHRVSLLSIGRMDALLLHGLCTHVTNIVNATVQALPPHHAS